MIRLIISGCNGKMGRCIAACAAQRDDVQVVAGFDVKKTDDLPFPVFSAPEQCTAQADAIIDFSHPSALQPLLAYAVEHHIPTVVATTGLQPEQLELVHQASERCPIFFSANMSLGVNLLVELAKKAAQVLQGSYDIEIVEKHHNQKLDAPSGTALMIANEISTVLNQKPQYVYDRHSSRKKRESNEIGIHAVRGGTIVGDHEVIFAGHDEVITLQHTAFSREIFATGSLNAAAFLVGKENGLYNMGDLI